MIVCIISSYHPFSHLFSSSCIVNRTFRDMATTCHDVVPFQTLIQLENFHSMIIVVRVDSYPDLFSFLNFFIIPLHITFTIFLLFTILISLPTSISSLYSFEALLIYVGWMTFHVVLERILPGSWFLVPCFPLHKT